MKKVTLKDIAKLANVSPTTVSLVLNNRKHRISKEKQDEIIKIAKQLDYRPNYLARSLSMKKTKTIAMLIPDIENPFFSTMARHVVKKLSKYDYHTFLGISEDSFHLEKKLIKIFEQREVDGFVLCMSNESYKYKDELSKIISDMDKPVVFVDRIFGKNKPNQIYFDNYTGGYLAGKYLLEKGSKKLLCITGDLETFNARERYRGYQDAIVDYGSHVEASYVREGDYRFISGFNITSDVIEKFDVDGVFAFNDLMAYGSMRAFSEKGLTLEKNINFVGYDNLSTSDIFDIGLTSIEQNIELISNLSADMLVKVIETGQEQDEIILDSELIIRDHIESKY